MNNLKKCIFLPFIALCSFHTYAANSPLAQELKAQANVQNIIICLRMKFIT
ncbi:hypothetical protein F966_00634 [Acinetobacter higginsii]|uniref:Uncharacterized protein n=1 Tax=Acinetobacter higginsii TaxID=70347 RepID=N8WFV7_9GAMM|nr:hypothetical protein F966_00634 [Acinetobacter higginsii]